MSITTLSAKIHALTPEDELIGSLTKERVRLTVQHAGAKSLESSADEAQRWLAYALNTDIPTSGFDQLCSAFRTSEHLESADLEHWFDISNTEFNRENILRDADGIIDLTTSILTNQLCAQLGVSK